MKKTIQKQAPFLIIAVGNRSRGDDAIGPLLLEQLQKAESAQLDVEFLEDFQLQVEHALDLKERYGVLFIDAALPDFVNSVSLKPIFSDQIALMTSHAQRAEAILYVSKEINGSEPPSWLLAIEGKSFGLGEDLSNAGRLHLKLAFEQATNWLAERRQELALQPSESDRCSQGEHHA